MADRYFTGWALDPAQRQDLLARFPPAYPEVIADHVTLAANVPKASPLPTETGGEIVGQADDGAGVQAMVVRIGGTTDRPGGGTYHITWSIDRARGRKPVHSNDVLASGWAPLPEPVPVKLEPKRYPFR